MFAAFNTNIRDSFYRRCSYIVFIFWIKKYAHNTMNESSNSSFAWAWLLHRNNYYLVQWITRFPFVEFKHSLENQIILWNPKESEALFCAKDIWMRREFQVNAERVALRIVADKRNCHSSYRVKIAQNWCDFRREPISIIFEAKKKIFSILNTYWKNEIFIPEKLAPMYIVSK